VFEIARKYVEQRGNNYNAWNDVIGAIELAKQELYARCIGPYERAKIIENGDLPGLGLVWAAGFFDGEGSIHCANIKTCNGRKSRRQLVLQVGQKTPLSLVRFQEAINAGSITFTNHNGPNKNQSFYNLHIHTYAGVVAALTKLWPWLGLIKRQQFLDCTNEFVDWRTKNPSRISTLNDFIVIPTAASEDWPNI
jgi:hypothetical protein